MNFTQPIEVAFGRYLQDFHAMLVATTPAMREFADRDFSKSAVWAPGRMIDSAEEMLATWRKNDTSQEDKATPYLPVMIAAMSKDYVPVTPDIARPLADPIWVQIPSDTKQRTFRMRAAVCEVRAQVVVCAAEKYTARSIAGQLVLYAQALERRRMYAIYPLAGQPELWPVQLENPDLVAVNVPTDVKNLTMLAVDVTMHATVPVLMHPRHSAADADGAGVGTEADPDGYLVVQEVDGAHYAADDAQRLSPFKSWNIT